MDKNKKFQMKNIKNYNEVINEHLFSKKEKTADVEEELDSTPKRDDNIGEKLLKYLETNGKNLEFDENGIFKWKGENVAFSNNPYYHSTIFLGNEKIFLNDKLYDDIHTEYLKYFDYQKTYDKNRKNKLSKFLKD